LVEGEKVKRVFVVVVVAFSSKEDKKKLSSSLPLSPNPYLQRRKLLGPGLRRGVAHVHREAHHGRLHDRATAAGEDRQLGDGAGRQKLEEPCIRDVGVADERHGALVVYPRLDLAHGPLSSVEGPLVGDAAQPAAWRWQARDDLYFAHGLVEFLARGKRVVRDARAGAELGVVARGCGGVEGPGGQVGVEEFRFALLLVALRGGRIFLAALEKLLEGALGLGQRPVGAFIAKVVAAIAFFAVAFREGVFLLLEHFSLIGGGRRRGGAGCCSGGGAGGVGARGVPADRGRRQRGGRGRRAVGGGSRGIALALALLLGIAALLLLLRLLLLVLSTLCDLFFLVGGGGGGLLLLFLLLGGLGARSRFLNGGGVVVGEFIVAFEILSKLREKVVLVEFLVVFKVFVAFLVVAAAASSDRDDVAARERDDRGDDESPPGRRRE